jgi:hypothetical protein
MQQRKTVSATERDHGQAANHEELLLTPSLKLALPVNMIKRHDHFPTEYMLQYK